MSWHGYAPNQRVHIDDLRNKCEERLRSGKVVDVEGKRKLLRQILNCGQDILVFSPQDWGWGRSPFNPNNWRTKSNEPI
jgi:hypothetical protein